MQELKILSEDNNTIILSWNKSYTANEYLLERAIEIFTEKTLLVKKSG